MWPSTQEPLTGVAELVSKQALSCLPRSRAKSSKFVVPRRTLAWEAGMLYVVVMETVQWYKPTPATEFAPIEFTTSHGQQLATSRNCGRVMPYVLRALGQSGVYARWTPQPHIDGICLTMVIDKSKSRWLTQRFLWLVYLKQSTSPLFHTWWGVSPTLVNEIIKWMLR